VFSTTVTAMWYFLCGTVFDSVGTTTVSSSHEPVTGVHAINDNGEPGVSGMQTRPLNASLLNGKGGSTEASKEGELRPSFEGPMLSSLRHLWRDILKISSESY
jgi:hypothetical protein